KENNPEPNPDCDPCAVGVEEAKQPPGQKGTEAGWATDQPDWAGWGTGEAAAGLEERENEQAMPGIIFTNEFGQEVPEATEDSEQEPYADQDEGNRSKWYLSGQADMDGSGSDYETAEEWGDAPGQNGGWVSADDELDAAENEGSNAGSDQIVPSSTVAQDGFADWGVADTASAPSAEKSPARVDFGSNAFSVNWDQADKTETGSEVTESEKQGLVSSTPEGRVDDSLLAISESTPSSDPFGTLDSDPFGNDPFATSGGDRFGTGNDPFANSEKDQFRQSETDASELPSVDTSAPFVTSGGDVFGPSNSIMEGQTTGFASDPFASQEADTGGWASDPFANKTTPDLFSSETNQDFFASDTNQDLFANKATQEPFTIEPTQDLFASEPTQDLFASEGTDDPFASEAPQDLFASEPTQDLFASEGTDDPFASEAPQNLFASAGTQDLFASEATEDPFASTGSQDLFAKEGTQDPFASKATQDLFASEATQDPFADEASQDPFSSETSQDPFANEDTQDLFASKTIEDPFASGTNQDLFSSQTTQDPFASESNQGWAGGWESASTGEAGGEGTESAEQSNGFAQWAAFPPQDTDPESSSKGSWQEVSGSSGFFSSDGQGDFIAGWPGESGQAQDQFASFPVHNNFPNPKAPSAENPTGPKEPENSDLSEDEVANRRYGKLYQEIDTEKDEVSNKAFNGFAQTDASAPAFAADFGEKLPETEAPEGAEAGTEAAPEGEVAPTPAPAAEAGEGSPVTTPPPAETTPPPAETTPPPAETTPPPAETTPPPTETTPEPAETTPAASPPAEEAPATEEDKESPIEETPTIEAKPEDEAGTVEAKPEEEAGKVEAKPEEEAGIVETKPEDEAGTVVTKPEDEAGNVEAKQEDEAGKVEPKPQENTGTVVVKPAEETSKEGAENSEEKMPIPSVVIEPASSNEGDDDRDGDIASPTATSGNGVIPDSQTAKDIPSSGMPSGFMYKVETMHDFDAANPDELELKRGDIVLVIPTELAEDQDAGWLTGVRESDWLVRGASAKKGLFPENFTQRLG
ncbi:amphiphysin isoform X7, partial [Astyanax mexicanus]